jgi:hypothetical protein
VDTEETVAAASREIENLKLMLASAVFIYHATSPELDRPRDMREKNVNQLRTGRDLLHPIRRLPAEVLVEILATVVEDDASEKRKRLLSEGWHLELASAAVFTLVAVC